MTAERFDQRTLANMEVALELACAVLAPAKRRPLRAKAHCARDLGLAEAGRPGELLSKAIAGHFPSIQ